MRGAGLLLLLLSTVAWGQDDDDAAALALGAATPAPAATVARSTMLTVEGALTEAAQQGAAQGAQQGVAQGATQGVAQGATQGAGYLSLQRLSLDGRFDGSFAPGFRAIVAERVDSEWSGAWGENQEVGTLKEAYVSWQPSAGTLADMGRINARQGVAFGYNPTDFFRADAIRSLVSLDPDSLRDNRLGTAMVRGEELWATGAITAAYAPRLTERTSAGALDPDWGATNSRGRWLVSMSQQLAPGWTPQWLLFSGDGQSPQAGMDITAALGAATVAYLEVSAGRSATLLAQALDQPERTSLRSRASTGVTYSMANKLSLTFEYEYNGTGLSAGKWNRLAVSDPLDYGRYRDFALLQQDLPTQSNAFVYASWQDLVFRHLDLTAFLRVDLVDHSKLPWFELRRHWTAVDLALRWTDVQGSAVSDFGASTQRQTWQLVLDYYL